MGIDWLPHETVYDRPQVEQILEGIHELREYGWPVAESSYTELPTVQHKSFPHAPYEMSCMIIAEVLRRVAKCGLDGYLVEDKYLNDLTEEEISQKRELYIGTVYSRINKVLWYVASGKAPGWMDTRWRWGMTYEKWKGNNCHFRKKVIVAKTR